jgi:hypothetical protein
MNAGKFHPNRRTALLGLCLLLLALPAAARTSVPIIDYPDQPVVTGSGKTPSAADVRQAIASAATQRNWVVTNGPGDERVTATLVVRNKHTISVVIAYKADAFSISYLGSVNMNYNENRPVDQASYGNRGYTVQQKDTTLPDVIHPNYNKWVQDLLTGIKINLRLL